MARTQLYYDEQGDYSWSLTVLEYWRYVEHDSESEEAARQVSEELEVLLRDCHPSPCVDLPPSSSSPESGSPSTPSPATFASPPTVSTDECATFVVRTQLLRTDRIQIKIKISITINVRARNAQDYNFKAASLLRTGLLRSGYQKTSLSNKYTSSPTSSPSSMHFLTPKT